MCVCWRGIQKKLVDPSNVDTFIIYVLIPIHKSSLVLRI